MYCPLKKYCYFALVVDDFYTNSTTIIIPAGTTDFEINNTFFRNDVTNEIDQSFALVGVVGDDVPDGLSCFQRRTGDPLCFGRTGGTTIKIEDNDRKYFLVCRVSKKHLAF